MQIPSFLLKKLYVKGSLENVDDGFQFKLKNSLSPGTGIGMEPLKLNETEYALDATTITSGEDVVKAADIVGGESFAIKVGVDILIHIKGNQLPEGEYKIGISLTTKEVGTLAFEVIDSL
ncbi:MAG: hypothetical protein KAR33_03575 [Candidatus Thorarchaeota archaeon]|nr:hypothetical protein [Candidatus Thorarchaeota archaeon]